MPAPLFKSDELHRLLSATNVRCAKWCWTSVTFAHKYRCCHLSFAALKHNLCAVCIFYQVRTLFVSGLPMDARPRELYLLFQGYKVKLDWYELEPKKKSVSVTFFFIKSLTKCNSLLHLVDP
jgi:hypothetical protein